MVKVIGYRLWVIVLCSLFFIQGIEAGPKWKTHFAYNNVTQIAVSQDKVYAISDGSLFSVEKQSEQVKVYNRLSGLHGTGITCIHYDTKGKQLLICYGDGKMDMLTEQGVLYISELYNKDMTQRKTIYNVTIAGRMAYLSTHYGVQTMDLQERKLVDSYWLRPGGQETPIQDVRIISDSIYAFAEDSMYCACLQDNVSDYSYWKREKRSNRITPDAKKGIEYEDASDIWYAGLEQGIKRYTKATQKWMSYKPAGPAVNIPYRLTAAQGNIWMVPGGRWSSQNERPAVLMRYDGQQWINIETAAIEAKTGMLALDFMNTAVDPKDKTHYFVTSYGTGIYEFRNDEVVHHEIANENNTMVSASRSHPDRYTRLDNALFDASGRLWFADAASSGQIQCLEANGTWHGIDIEVDGALLSVPTPGGLIIDHRNAHHKWLAVARYYTCLCLIDDGGTPFDTSDDRTKKRDEWTDQEGNLFKPSYIYDLLQDRKGRIWLATEQGLAYIETTDFFHSDAIVRPVIMDENGENPIRTNVFKALCETADGAIWAGSESLGIYVLNEEATEITTHFTTENSAMPANGILSLAAADNEHVFIGTAEGLVEYDPNGYEEGLNGLTEEGDYELEEGSMQQWRLHFCYSNPNEIAASDKRVYAAANGALFCVNRADETIDYWNKSTGLNGTSVSHIAYDERSGQLIIAYDDGRMDLLSDNDAVTQMPDLYMKAGSVAVTINCLSTGSRYAYAGTTFGIIAINTRKAEVADTYYIGPEASAVDVRAVIEQGDSLYAFSANQLYKAALSDNLVDYTFWSADTIRGGEVQQAAAWQEQLYIIQHDSLYRRTGDKWLLVRNEPIHWMNAHDGNMLVYTDKGLFRLKEDDSLEGLNNLYAMNSACFTKGEYWVAETNWGLIKLDTNGDHIFHTEGPNSNFGYSMHAANGHIYSTVGGRWATEFIREARINIFDGYNWRGISAGEISAALGVRTLDPVSVAVDPSDAGHFFVAMYGTGVIEFRDYKAVKQYTNGNSTLKPVNTTVSHPEFFVRTDGVMIDEAGNLWVLNATDIGKPVHVMTPDGLWYGLRLRSNGSDVTFTTPSGIWPDKRDSRYKWMFDQRYSQGVILMDDGGTPTNNYDDRCLKRSSFVDQNGTVLTPSSFRCFAQDHTNRIWIGTEKGIFLIPETVDFYQSNACRRIIIPRNDGTGLGDYLLGDEQINCMAVDGGNRMWIGTANSGLYLIEDDTITVAHFTEYNSLLPSNSIQSIAIMPTTGEVFVGTGKGIASYRSDASDPAETMSGAYAYPNPVRPDYGGVISICGLMDNTTVNIVDAAGNLVCKTKSHGGTAVWDGRLYDGRRATPGIYTALCNANGGHTVVKIMVIR